jgi:type VI protein secretion system component VasK
MEILVREVARNTNLSATPKPKDWLGWIKSFFEKSDAGQTGGNSEVEREFKPLFDFVKDNEKTEGSAASQYRSAFRPLVESLDNVTDDKVKQISADLAKDRDTLGLRKAESTVNARLEAFTTTAAQDVADLLKKPLQNLRVFFGADAQNQLEKTWREQIFPKAQEIERGFPFNDAGEADLPKLTAYLNPVNGTLSKFYSERLEKYFEEVGGQFKVKESSEVKFNQDFVAYLNNAFRLREALYGKGATPNFEYEFKLQPAKDTIIEASIDGNKITSEGTSSGKFTFPARAGAETGAILQLVSTAEPVSTSGAAANSSANTNAANVSTTTNANVRSNFQQTNSNNAAPGSLRFSGQWGLFRMIDAGTPQKNQNGEYALTFKVGGKTVSASVRPTGGDLFDKNLFRQVRAPQNMLK